MTTTPAPKVLFVCVRNGGKSQMAAALLRHAAGDTMQVSSAGTDAGPKLNALSVQVLAENSVDIADQRTRQLTPEMVADADLVITLGSEATVDPGDSGTPVENWDTDEPSTRGIDGIERMRLVRDDIAAKVQDLVDRLRQQH